MIRLISQMVSAQAVGTPRKRPVLGGVAFAALVVVAVAGGALFFSGVLTSSATQIPEMHIDMITTGNTYDEATNSMAVGTIDTCLATAAPGSTVTHAHTAHLILRNTEDLVAWTARANYIGDKMRILSFSAAPFIDNNTGQNVGFVNLPLDGGVHRDISPAGTFPAAPADGSNTPQTAAFGAIYVGGQTFPVSPDTPHKTTPDDATYDAPNGGILATVTLQVVGNESTTGPNGSNPQLFINLDDNSPNGPLGSQLEIFTGTGQQTVTIPPERLGDAFHGEGRPCSPDSDQDGQSDSDERACGSDPEDAGSRSPDNDGDRRPDCVDVDDDNDTIPDVSDNCPNTPEDLDGFEDADVCPDADNDQDGVPDGSDNCRDFPNADQANNDVDGQGDACDSDDDNDGVTDTTDNCPFTSNTGQQDLDGDGQGDACDSDVDGDGVANGNDACPATALAAAVDSAGCSQAQVDADGDGVCDPSKTSDRWCVGSDACPSTPTSERPVDSNGCSQHQVDGDLDGACDPGKASSLCSGSDNCPTTPNPTQIDSDGDGLGNHCDGVGRATIPANAPSLTIQFVPINPGSSVVLLTPLSDPGTNILWVSLGTNQFTVNVRALGNQKHAPIQFMYEVIP